MFFHFPSKVRFDKPLANPMQNDTFEGWDVTSAFSNVFFSLKPTVSF